jgi:hypothetical protein
MESENSVSDWVQKGLSLPNEADETLRPMVQALFPSLHDNQLIIATHSVEIMVAAVVIGLVLELMEPMNAISLVGIASIGLTLYHKDWYPPIVVGFLALCSWYLVSIAKIILLVLPDSARAINDTLQSIDNKLYSIDNKLYSIDSKLDSIDSNLYSIDSAIEQAKDDIELRELNKN